MGQLISVIVHVMLLLTVPLGFVQIHTAIQMKNELLDLSFAVTKQVSNRGGLNEADIQKMVRDVIRQELATKTYRLEEEDIQAEIVRTKAAQHALWSHEDEFRLSLSMPFPLLSPVFNKWATPLSVTRTGTINMMDYDLQETSHIF